MQITCPRCGASADEEFYGPCSDCRAVLRSSGREARAVAAADYEPKMNVTPNAVATKE
jgi:predicted amidophosphoribosyltransferase